MFVFGVVVPKFSCRITKDDAGWAKGDGVEGFEVGALFEGEEFDELDEVGVAGVFGVQDVYLGWDVPAFFVGAFAAGDGEAGCGVLGEEVEGEIEDFDVIFGIDELDVCAA